MRTERDQYWDKYLISRTDIARIPVHIRHAVGTTFCLILYLNIIIQIVAGDHVEDDDDDDNMLRIAIVTITTGR